MTDEISEAAALGIKDAIMSPPIVPVSLSTEQWRFLWLHARHNVVRWQWFFSETQLRAFTDRGTTATISRESLRELVDAGLMRYGGGIADMMLTDLGKELGR